MSELSIYILIIFLISVSLSVVLYIVLDEYKRIKHLRYVKAVLENSDENKLLLQTKEEQSQSFINRVKAFMLLAGFEFSPYIFLVIAFVVALIFAFLCMVFLHHWSGLTIGFLFGGFIFYSLIRAVIARRKREFNRALANSISVLVKMMKNGIGFEQALLKAITVSNSAMFKKIFANFFQEKNTIGEVEAFTNLNRFVKSKELLIFALAIKIGRGSGGQFSNTLEKVEKTISYRKNLQDKVDVITREGSLGSYIVIVIAIFLYFALNGNFNGKLHQYFMDSEFGRFQLLGIFLWVFVGILVNKLITKVEK